MAVPAPAEVADARDVARALEAHDYLPDTGLATAVFLALKLQRPLLLEGDAGVGKTEVAKVLSRWTGGELLRLQCYEGLDVSQAVYEWDYSRQLLHLRAAEATGLAEGAAVDQLEDELYDERFLVARPLLEAVRPRQGPPPVLLIDEVDRADDEFEAFLLEVLSDYTVTVPELGTFHAKEPPIVVITSNRTRDVHDALKRRCLYHWVEHPDFEREVAIVGVRAPGVGERLARQVAAATEAMREAGLYKPPGVAETIDWAGRPPRPRRHRARRRHRRRLARHGAEVPRGPGARAVVGARPARRPRRRPHRVIGEVAPSRVHRDPATAAVAFVRALRQAGMVVPIDSSVTFVSALEAIDPSVGDDVYWAGRTTLVRRAEDIAVYDHLFAAFFGGVPLPRPDQARTQSITLATDDGEDDAGSGDDVDDDGNPTVQVRFSRVETLRHKDFATYDEDELAEAWALMDRLRLVGRAPTVPASHAHPARPRPSRPASHRPLRAALGRRAVPPRPNPAGRAVPAGGAADRRVRIDGALRPGAAAVRARGGRGAGSGRGLRPGDPAHAHDPRAVTARPRRGARAGRRPWSRTSPAAPVWARA